MTSWSPLAHREVGPKKVKARDHQVVEMSDRPHECLNQCTAVSAAVSLVIEEFSVSCIRHMIQKQRQGTLTNTQD